MATELYRSDGTDLGTFVVLDLSSSDDSDPRNFVDLDGTAYFVAETDSNARQLLKTDGTALGTQAVTDFPNFGGVRGGPIVARDVLYFFGDDGGDGRTALWISDGTAAGTYELFDTDPLETSGEESVDFSLAAAGSGRHAVFSSDDDDHGKELWITDGTAAGTQMVADTYPGPEGSHPSQLARAGSTLFFQADDGTHGSELWGLAMAETGAYVAEVFGVGCAGTGGVVPGISWSASAPVLGATFSVNLDQALPGAAALLGYSMGYSTLTLGTDCSLYLALPASTLFTGITDGTGHANALLLIPPFHGLVGLPLTLQYYAADPAGALGVVALTPGLEILVGT